MNRRLACTLSLAFSIAAPALWVGTAHAQASAPTAAATPTQRLRGSIVSFDGSRLVLAERGGSTINLVLAETFGVNEVVAIAPSDIKAGSYIGTAAMPAADGSLSALEVLVFPEAARGTGEGHSAWDLQPGSTMTNATVAELAASPNGRTMKLKYKDGEKSIVVPDNVPIVTLKPGDKSLLVAGAKVVVFAQNRAGTMTAMRALAGRNGLAPPM